MNKVLNFLRFGCLHVECPSCNTGLTCIVYRWRDVRLRCSKCDWWVNSISGRYAMKVLKRCKAELEAVKEQSNEGH